MEFLAIVQARCGSVRLPGKVLMPLLGKTVLARVIGRVKKAKTISGVIVATTENAADNPIADFCRSAGVDCFRGSENDVLDRFYKAAVKFSADNIIRITADCPVIDPHIIDEVVAKYKAAACDYCTNTMPPTYPDGLDVEVFSFNALEKAWKEALLTSEREHVTPYIRNRRQLFKVCNVLCKTDLSALRWTIDTEQDYEFIKAVYEKIKDSDAFSMEDVLDLLQKKPELGKINAGISRNEGYLKSLLNDGKA